MRIMRRLNMKFKFYMLLLIFISINLQSLQKTKLLLGVSKTAVGAIVFKSVHEYFCMRYHTGLSINTILKNDDLRNAAAASIAAGICCYHGLQDVLQAHRNDEQKFK